MASCLFGLYLSCSTNVELKKSFLYEIPSGSNSTPVVLASFLQSQNRPVWLPCGPWVSQAVAEKVLEIIWQEPKRLLPLDAFIRNKGLTISSEFEWWKVIAYFHLLSWRAVFQCGVIWMTSRFWGHSGVIEMIISSQSSVGYFSVSGVK
jgi:hypothetical protein